MNPVTPGIPGTPIEEQQKVQKDQGEEEEEGQDYDEDGLNLTTSQKYEIESDSIISDEPFSNEDSDKLIDEGTLT